MGCEDFDGEYTGLDRETLEGIVKDAFSACSKLLIGSTDTFGARPGFIRVLPGDGDERIAMIMGPPIDRVLIKELVEIGIKEQLFDGYIIASDVWFKTFSRFPDISVLYSEFGSIEHMPNRSEGFFIFASSPFHEVFLFYQIIRDDFGKIVTLDLMDDTALEKTHFRVSWPENYRPKDL